MVESFTWSFFITVSVCAHFALISVETYQNLSSLSSETHSDSVTANKNFWDYQPDSSEIVLMFFFSDSCCESPLVLIYKTLYYLFCYINKIWLVSPVMLHKGSSTKCTSSEKFNTEVAGNQMNQNMCIFSAWTLT